MIGCGGAGKSTFSRQLSARTGLPVIHLDTLYWKPGWTPTPAEDWSRLVGELLSRDAWIMDGNYGGTMDLRLSSCDTVIFLDRSRLACLCGVLRRRFQSRARPDQAAGCPERLSWEFLRWVWSYRRLRRPGILARLAAASSSRRVVILRSRREMGRFLSHLAPAEQGRDGSAGGSASAARA